MSKKSILVVADSEESRNGLAIFLVSRGYDTATAESGEEAVSILSKKRFDLVLTDLKMQHLDGIGVLKEVKKLHSLTDVIIMTAFASIETAVGAIKEGAFDYITKPLNMDELELTIQRCIEKQRLQEEVTALKDIVNLYVMSKAMGSVVDMNELLAMILKLACDSVNADGSSLMLYDRETDDLEIKVATGSFNEAVVGKKIRLGERFAGHAAELRRHLRQEDVEHEDWFRNLLKFENIESGMSIPMIIQDELVGVINLKRTVNKEKFTKRDMELAGIFSEQAAYAINNAWAYEKIKDINKNKSRLLSAISARLEDSFGVITSSLGSLEISPSRESETALSRIKASLSRIRLTAENISDFAKLESGKYALRKETLELNVLIDQVLEDFAERAAAKNIMLNTELPNETIRIRADPSALTRLLANILSNALQFTPQSGNISISLDKEDGLARVTMKDTGTGIAPDKLDDIFSKYSSLSSGRKDKQRGAGLGLPVSRQIAELHLGTLVAASEEGKGSSFTLSLPLS